jgi:hypothetical protein
MKSTSVSEESQWYGCDRDIMKLLTIQQATEDHSPASNEILFPAREFMLCLQVNCAKLIR